MTFNMISDIHIGRKYSFGANVNENNYATFKPELLKGADYLLIAGDLGTCETFKSVQDDIWNRVQHKFTNMFVIPGNHDYWTNTGKSILEHDEFLTVHLDHNTVLLGTTMWTPIKEYRPTDGAWHNSEEFLIHRFMNDYTHIPDFSIKKHNAKFKLANAWLHACCEQYKNKKLIVMTHHCPRRELISAKYLDNPLNAAYFVTDWSCDDLHPDIWLSGHSHERHDKTILGTRFINNAVGYHDFGQYEFVPECPTTHWYDNIITL